jgi:hypothetical protein
VLAVALAAVTDSVPQRIGALLVTGSRRFEDWHTSLPQQAALASFFDDGGLSL